MKVLKAGALLAVIGIVLIFVGFFMVENEKSKEYSRRAQFLQEKGTEISQSQYERILFAPYLPMPSESLVGVGWILAGIGVLTVFIKLVQGTD